MTKKNFKKKRKKIRAISVLKNNCKNASLAMFNF